MQGEDINELCKGEQFAKSFEWFFQNTINIIYIFHIAHYITLFNSVLLIADLTKLDHILVSITENLYICTIHKIWFIIKYLLKIKKLNL